MTKEKKFKNQDNMADLIPYLTGTDTNIPKIDSVGEERTFIARGGSQQIEALVQKVDSGKEQSFEIVKEWIDSKFSGTYIVH